MRRNYHLSDNLDEITLTSIESLFINEQREDSFIDYKGKQIPKGISDVVCSFLNNLGGHIIFGVEERDNFPKKFIGIDKREISKLNERLKNLRPYLDISPNFKEIKLNEKSVLAILFIPRFHNRWFLSKGKFYVRRGDSSDPIGSEEEIKAWKDNHPENRIELKSIINKLQTNTNLLEKLNESQDQCEQFIYNFFEVLSILLPL